VQLHAANGYLIDQFLRDGTNRREDSYGGPVENRIRLLTEVTQTLIKAAGADRIGVRLSPNDDPQGCGTWRATVSSSRRPMRRRATKHFNSDDSEIHGPMIRCFAPSTPTTIA
jgi:2,4-dienoyl-CoA reductase-like NADH-dependent reductase (Old Yellow Enzyme family)